MTMRGAPQQHRRGFATFTAVMLVGFIGVALSSLTLALASQSRRTGGEAAEAQLRQMIIAGQLQARELIQSHRVEPVDQVVPIALPAALARDGATLQVRFKHDAAGIHADVVAALGSRHVIEPMAEP
jgi:hypothetical protein